MIVLQIISATFLIGGIEILEAAAKNADDDQVIEAGKELQQIPMGLLIVLLVLQLSMFGLGVQGAIAYKKWMVMCALAAYSLSFVMAVFQLSIFGMIQAGFFAYPHVFFIREMDQNIMTPENYPNEVQSCCCV